MGFLLLLLTAFVGLNIWTTATDVPRTSRQPAPGKAFYTLFPKQGMDVLAIEKFMKSTLGIDDLLPWTDISDTLVSWTVEASPDELETLKSEDGIERVVQANSPTRREDAKDYIIFPVDGYNQAQRNATQLFLEDLIKPNALTPPLIHRNGELHFWAVKLTKDQRDAAAKEPGVQDIADDRELTNNRATPPEVTGASQLTNRKIIERELRYETQRDAVNELRFVSQPTSVPDLNRLENYVYESHQGDGIYVYHIEYGVAYKSQSAEFPNVVSDSDHVLTPLARMIGSDPSVDASDESHSTCTADKAVGAKYGSSKGAKLVVVKMGAKVLAELMNAVNQVVNDIYFKPERKKKSVVTISLSSGLPKGGQEETRLKGYIEELFTYDVPVVVAAGNDAEEESRSDVDEIPAVWAEDEFPLIVVGSVNAAGARSSFSQGGKHLTVHAPGEDTTCLYKAGNTLKTGSGTSFATPLTAGQIANLLSYDEPPFDMSDGKVVANVRNYVASDQFGWVRDKVLGIWNGVDEAHNPPVVSFGDGSGTTAPPVHKQCSGLGGREYVGRDELKRIIEKEFCPTAVEQRTLDSGSAAIMRSYNSGKMDAVAVAIEWPPNAQFEPNPDDCHKYLLQEIVDGCDGDNPDNPENFKGGGFFSVGDVTYRITPLTLRQPPKNGKQGGCDCTYNFADTRCWVWGSGWASADQGGALKGQLKDCALFPTGWTFDYGLGDDGREWSADFLVGIGQRDCVTEAAKESGANTDFVCHGNG
ncbi:putative Peptidase S8/S53 domain-containing protein [Seiridium cardinale]|uniref:Peptidase S8/S53 domain-containing protein n=1 Tax=Seiridium cardinale TaxID=138064 RepID=A0ABR2XJN5_9PEZI